MDLETVVQLVRAGYTRDEINALIQPDPQPAPGPDPQPTPEPEPQPAPEPEPQSELTAVLDALRELTTTLKVGNVQTRGVNTITMSAEEALGKVLTGGKANG